MQFDFSEITYLQVDVTVKLVHHYIFVYTMHNKIIAGLLNNPAIRATSTPRGCSIIVDSIDTGVQVAERIAATCEAEGYTVQRYVATRQDFNKYTQSFILQ